MSVVRIGLAGYGFGGRIFHAPLLAAAAGVELAGVVTRSPERRGELAADHLGVPAFATLADLRAAGADAVAISTPLDSHAPLALEAIGLGLGVVVDKPFARDAAEARTVVAAAEDAGVPLSVYQNRRWDSDFLTVRRLLDERALGELTLFESGFERFATAPVPASGGGILRDFGSHLVDQALHLFGPVATVFGDVPPADGLEERFLAVLHHTGGVTTHLRGDWRQGAPGPRFRVRGTEGAYVVFGMDGQEHALIAGERPGDGWYAEAEDRWGRIERDGDAAPRPVASERGRWDAFYPAFARAVRGEEPVPVDPRDAIASLTVLDAIRQSAAERRAITL